ncbi:MAG: protein phosphatase 2C domain-containing protein, partial [Armatimonadota bacterium]|nr:protein phosphatase 2C domain-containing protein [Armatimonadota bacterium]
MNVIAGAKTDLGQRPNNEDQFAVVDTRKRQIRADGVLIVADGMGGRNFGEQAAAAAVETVEESLAELLDNRQPGGEVIIGDALASALRKANARVDELARADEDR